MDPERWRRIERIYYEALERGADGQSTFIDEACGADEELRHEVKTLLSAHEQAEGFIATPAIELEARAIATDKIPAPGATTIGHFELLSLLGQGGMGEVYLARDTRLKRNVALKLLPAAYALDADRVRRFEQEALAASALNHPNILTVYEIGRIEEAYFIATEFVDGETLRQRLERGPLGAREVVEIAIQIAGALAAAHKAGIVHRDIKPENIMMRRDEIVKVVDFGLAKLTLSDAEAGGADLSKMARGMARGRTAPGVILGTLNYMSPEQARGSDVDQRSDLFCLGIVLYELIAGRSPFTGDTPADVIAAILEKQPPPLTQENSVMPPELDRIVTNLLVKDRECRYQRAEVLLGDLRRVRRRLEFPEEFTPTRRYGDAEGGWGARTDGFGPTGARPRTSKVWLYTAAASLLLIAIFFLAGRPFILRPADPRPTSAPPAPVELIRYFLETMSPDGVKTAVNGLEPLAANLDLKLHFTARRRGFLYIVAPDEKNALRAFLTAQPTRSSGVVSNEVIADVDYVFPAGDDNWIGLTAGSLTTRFTIVFSPTPLTSPSFLAAPARKQLTPAEREEWEAFLRRLDRASHEAIAGSPGVKVIARSEITAGETVVFDITIKKSG
ncbi:MAG TPA: serine/threonine-protein kinase [Blastocatellia bacterium]|nr:serine/threonine-protein kinase [Blastocatellia bacterium]